eukprot:gene16029-7374_t
MRKAAAVMCLKAKKKFNKVPKNQHMSNKVPQISPHQKIRQRRLKSPTVFRRSVLREEGKSNDKEIAHQKAIEYSANEYTGKSEPAAGSFRYLSPTHHADLLDCIVESDRLTIKDRFESVLAVSLRTDGSVDRMQHCHLMAKIVDLKGTESLLFLGFAECKERGAEGYLKTFR